MAPVVSINVINIGSILFVKPTKSCMVSFTIVRQFEKLAKITTEIIINSTKYAICETLLFSKVSVIAIKMLCIIIIIKTIPNTTYTVFKFFS